MLSIRLINLLFLSMLIDSCNAEGGQQKMAYAPEKTNITYCDSFKVYVESLLLAKVDYERAVYHVDTLSLKIKKDRYYSLVVDFKSNKEQNLNCIDQELEKKDLAQKKKLIQFSYYPQYSGSIPICGHIDYISCLLLLKYNLSILETNKELVCNETDW
jgi:hypothetical protein